MSVQAAGPIEPSPDTVDTRLQLAQQFMESSIFPRFQKVVSELAMAVDWNGKKGWFIYGVENRDYPFEQYSDCQFGTMDLILQNGDWSKGNVELCVADWKTGTAEGAEEQLLTLLAGSVMAYRVLEDLKPGQFPKTMRIMTILVTEEKVIPVEREVSVEELEAHIDAMSWRWDEILKGQSKPVAGIHCTQLYCPHLAHCPEIAKTLLEASEGQQGLLSPEQLVKSTRFQMTDVPNSDAEAAFVMERISAAKRQLNYYTEAMKAYVNNGGTIRSGKFVWSQGKDGYRWRKE